MNDLQKATIVLATLVGYFIILFIISWLASRKSDTNTALKNESGALKEDYWSYDTLALSKEAYTTICEYILTHTA